MLQGRRQPQSGQRGDSPPSQFLRQRSSAPASPAAAGADLGSKDANEGDATNSSSRPPAPAGKGCARRRPPPFATRFLSTWESPKRRSAMRLAMASLGVLAIVAILQLYPTLRRTYRHCFGTHPMEGGSIGHRLDGILSQYAIDTAFRRQTKFLRERGVVIPDRSPVSRYRTLDVNSHAALREVLLRRETRSKLMVELDAASGEGCRSEGTNRRKGKDASASDFGAFAGIPKILHIPDLPGWVVPRPGVLHNFKRLTFDEVEMKRFIEDNHKSLLPAFTSMKDPYERILLWTVVVVYRYGGIVVGNTAKVNRSSIDAISSMVSGEDTTTTNQDCAPPLGLIASETHDLNRLDESRIAVLAATPYHPHLGCILEQVENGNDISNVLGRLFSVETRGALGPVESHPFPVRITHAECSPEWTNGFSTDDLRTIARRKTAQSEFFGHLRLVNSQPHIPEYLSRTTVSIKEKGNPKKPLVESKVSMEKVLRDQGGEPNWLCSRCLKSPVFGSLEKCSQVCSSTYQKLICEPTDRQSTTTIDVDVDISKRSRPAGRIPRIVHQTWFEPITPDLYPQLSRLQNSWKQSGWEYRFYTDADAREYIIANYPTHFLEAFEAVIPGAYKADLFRYLVLLKDGGIYADVDVKLEATLDSFVTPDLSFFAPRDAVGEYADEPFCLWNGLIGSEAGHPFMLRAVERLVNLIIERADLYDLERSVCHSDGPKTENWKVRIEPQLLLSGPCALGIAVNEALDRRSLTRLDLGWLPRIEGPIDYGDSLILVGDKYDLGSFRVSDPERNIMVAATELPGINKESRVPSFLTTGDKLRLKSKKAILPHYSTTTLGRFIWGQDAVYKDDVVIKKQIRMKASTRILETEKGTW